MRDRVVLHVVEQQAGLEQDEILGVRFDEINRRTAAVLTRVGIGIVAVGEEDDLHVQSFFEDQIDPAQRGLDARRVAVVQDGDVLV